MKVKIKLNQSKNHRKHGNDPSFRTIVLLRRKFLNSVPQENSKICIGKAV